MNVAWTSIYSGYLRTLLARRKDLQVIITSATIISTRKPSGVQ